MSYPPPCRCSSAGPASNPGLGAACTLARRPRRRTFLLAFGFLAQGVDVGPQPLPGLPFLLRQGSQGLVVAAGGQVGVLAPAGQTLLDDLPAPWGFDPAVLPQPPRIVRLAAARSQA